MSEQCQCPNESRLVILEETNKTLKKVLLTGNGKPSIQESVIRLNVITENLEKGDIALKEQLSKLTTSVNALTMAYSENIGAKEVKTEIRADKKWKVTTMISVLLASIAFLKDFLIELFTKN